MTSPDGYWVHLKDYTDQRFADHDKRLEDIRDTASKVADSFLPRAQYDAQHSALLRRVEAIEDRQDQEGDRISALQGRAIAIAGVVSLIGATVSAIVTAIVVHLVANR